MKLIDLSVLKYQFKTKPLLIGGKAMEYYGLRKAGSDIDFVVTKEDFDNLAKLYPGSKKDLSGDLGIYIFNFEIWLTISYFDYPFLSKDAVEEKNYKIFSLDRLLFMKMLGVYFQKKNKNETLYEKYSKDVDLLVEKIEKIQWEKIKKESNI